MPIVRSRQGKKAPTSIAASKVVLALHTLKTKPDESLVAAFIEDAANRIARGEIEPSAVLPDKAWPYKFEVIQVEMPSPSRPLRLIDYTTPASKANPSSYPQIARRWKAIARFMINPAIGWRPQTQRNGQEIVKGFGQIEEFSNLVRAYTEAAVYHQNIEETDVLVRLPSPYEALQVKLWSSNAFNVKTNFDYNFAPGMTEMAEKLALRAPIAYQVSPNDDDTPEDFISAMDYKINNYDLTTIAIRRLELRHERISGNNFVDCAKTMRNPALSEMSFKIVEENSHPDKDFDSGEEE